MTSSDLEKGYISGYSTMDLTSNDAASGKEDARQETSVDAHKNSSSTVAALDSISNCAAPVGADDIQRLLSMTRAAQELTQKDSSSPCILPVIVRCRTRHTATNGDDKRSTEASGKE